MEVLRSGEMTSHKELFDCSDVSGFEDLRRRPGWVSCGRGESSEKHPALPQGRSHAGMENAGNVLGQDLTEDIFFKGREH